MAFQSILTDKTKPIGHDIGINREAQNGVSWLVSNDVLLVDDKGNTVGSFALPSSDFAADMTTLLNSANTRLSSNKRTVFQTTDFEAVVFAPQRGAKKVTVDSNVYVYRKSPRRLHTKLVYSDTETKTKADILTEITAFVNTLQTRKDTPPTKTQIKTYLDDFANGNKI